MDKPTSTQKNHDYASTRSALIMALACAIFGYACSSDPNTGNNTSSSSSGTGGAGGTGGSSSSGMGGDEFGGFGGLGPGKEVCDGLDNDVDQTVDEDCSCSGDTTQPCYPMNSPPPEGCRWGEQTCMGGIWGQCTKASIPPEGKDACCTVLGDTPEFTLLDGFTTAYPPAAMPKSVPAVTAFAPMANGHGMTWTQVNPANEFVDANNGGVIAPNILSGLSLSKQAAIDSLPVGWTVEATGGEQVIIEDLGGTCGSAPSGVGWSWGSILVKGPDDAVSELVYLYIGICSNGDTEAFYYSDVPVQVCEPPVVPH